MESGVFKDRHEVLAFVFNAVPWDSQWPGDVKDGVQVIVERQHGTLAEQLEWHADKGKIVHPFEYIFDALDLRMVTAVSAGRPWIPPDKARLKMVQCST